MNWRRRTSSSLPIKAEPPAFLEFELGAAPNRRVSAGPLVELELGGGIILRIHPVRP
jgi:hypothetical protein